jgi:hypothetical protein
VLEGESLAGWAITELVRAHYWAWWPVWPNRTRAR